MVRLELGRGSIWGKQKEDSEGSEESKEGLDRYSLRGV